MNTVTIITYLKNRYLKSSKENAKLLNSKTLSMLHKNNVISFGDYFRLSCFNSNLYTN